MSGLLRRGASVGAVVVGFIATFALSVLGDVLMHGFGVFPPPPEAMSEALFAWALTYRVGFTVIGGYLTARLAPDRPMRHGAILAVIGTIAGSLGVVGWWFGPPGLGPAWYPVAIALTGAPAVLVGARIAAAGRTGA